MAKDRRVRRTIPELEFLSALLDRAAAKKAPKTIHEMIQYGVRRVGDPNPWSLREHEIRRKLAAREMGLLRRDAQPGLGRQAERDRIRRAVGVLIGERRGGGYDEFLNPQNLRDFDNPSDLLADLYGDDTRGWGHDDWWAVQNAPPERQIALRNEIQAKINAEMASNNLRVVQEKARRAAPLLLKLGQPTSRRDFLRAMLTPAKKAAINATPLGAISNAVSSESPLLMKVIKAFVSRFGRPPV